MDAALEIGNSVPFPPLPDGLADAYGARGLRLRRFGTDADDLSIDFALEKQPDLLTKVLRCCALAPGGAPVDSRFFWELEVGNRIECLVALAALDGAGNICFEFVCPRPSCREPIDLDLTLEEFLAGINSSPSPFAVDLGDRRIWVRRPTGTDQISWLSACFVDPESAIRSIARSLVVDGIGELTAEWLRRIEERLEQEDPLVQFHLDARCPGCEQVSAYDIDIVEFAFGRLKQAQTRLIESVGRLAAHYHWTESEILSIPAWRRAQYLALADRGEAR